MNTTVVDMYYQMAVMTIRMGGGTFARDAARSTTLPYRYIVALGRPHTRVTNVNASRIARALRELSDTRQAWTHADGETSHNRALGTWIDQESGVVYVDVVESYHVLGVALQVARKRGELAIFDTVTGEEIRVG